MDVKSSTKISKYRIHNSVINRMTTAAPNSAITPVDPVTPVTNNTALISYNSLMASDQFYDNLSRLRKEYKRFYHDQQELEKALNDIKENRNSGELLGEHLKLLVEKYNMAFSSLKEFDLQFGTNHRKCLEDLINRFKENLLSIGVTIKEDSILIFDEAKFKSSILESKNALKFLFRPIKGLIINLHRAFKNINIPEEENAYDEYGHRDYNGMITDEKI